MFACVFQVLLEAQEMAVKNHNVEYKSNLFVGECEHLHISTRAKVDGLLCKCSVLTSMRLLCLNIKLSRIKTCTKYACF